MYEQKSALLYQTNDIFELPLIEGLLQSERIDYAKGGINFCDMLRCVPNSVSLFVYEKDLAHAAELVRSISEPKVLE